MRAGTAFRSFFSRTSVSALIVLFALASPLLLIRPGLSDDAPLTVRGVIPNVARDEASPLHLNQIQVVGTHNSYHLQLRPAAFALLQQAAPKEAMEWEFSHAPLDQQLTAGIRQIELDAYADPAGGLYANPLGLRLIGENPPGGIPELLAPGFKVLHTQDIDFETNCFTLVSCLTVVRTWSDAHPGHLPVVIMIEAKEEPLPEDVIDPALGIVTPLPIGAAEFDALDAEILSVFSRSRIIEPDDIRGDEATVDAGVQANGWPTLDEARGKVLFVLDNREKRADYLAGHPALEGRVMFTDSRPGEEDGAFLILNNPIAQSAEIRAAVTSGYLVRTRADENTVEARSGDVARRDAAFSSGAQFISTDFPWYAPAVWTGYSVELPGGAATICNVVVVPLGCPYDPVIP
ncbi:MAG TPA: phosphatidylinositol-specific phospholipase C1-like protein [Tepidiformaceae bacterium]|nr:phosphatidylinositol-specific phospholipase C1-like protein [Tepidiformaceae bacterium]